MSIYEAGNPDEFFTICPRDSMYLDYNVKPIRLRIVREGGVEGVPDVNIVVNDMASGVKHFQNNSGKGDTFKVNVLIKVDDTIVVTKEYSDNNWENEQLNFNASVGWGDNGNGVFANLTKNIEVVTALDYWIKTATPLNVVTRAIDIPNGLYIIKENSSRKQTYEGYTLWVLEFIKYVTYNSTDFKSSSKGVTTALNNYNKAKEKAKKKTQVKNKAKYQTTSKYKLGHKCDYKKLVYSKKKKVVTCVKYLQLVLYNNKCYPKSKVNQIDGWYGKVTYNAVKTFQKKYHSKYNLKVTGKVDYLTYRVLCGFSVKTTSNKKK